MTRLAIFDLDGTLLDTVKDLGNATNHALTECGFPTHPIEAYYQMVGRGIYNLFRVAVPAGQSTEEVVQGWPPYSFLTTMPTNATSQDHMTAFPEC